MSDIEELGFVPLGFSLFLPDTAVLTRDLQGLKVWKRSIP